MKVKVNEDVCIGCGTCCAICDEVFEFNNDGIACVKSDADIDKYSDEVKTAIESCPTEAIIEKDA